MSMIEEVLNELNPIFKKAFGNNDLVLSPELTKDQIDGWDSFTSVDLLIAVELHFKIKIPVIKAKDINSVRDLLDIIIELKK